MRAQTFFITALLVAIIIIGAKSQSGPFLFQNCDDLGFELSSAENSLLDTNLSDISGHIRLLSDSLARKRITLDAVYIVCGNHIKVGNVGEGRRFDTVAGTYHISSFSEKDISGNSCEISWEDGSLTALPGEYCIFMNISRTESFVSDTFCGKVL